MSRHIFPPLPCRVLVLLLVMATGRVWAQDTIVLYGDTIRVGGLEWDMQKDWRAHGTRIAENRELYGDHVRILLAYHPNRNVSSISFGYIDKELGFVKHGPSRFYYDWGPLRSKRTFVEGQAQGLAEDFHPEGRLWARTWMRDGQLHGRYDSWYPDGTHETQCGYIRDSLHGRLLAWYSNGAMKRIEHWDMDRKTGVDSTFYESGKLESTVTYMNDLQDGPTRYYHRNGTPWSEWVYVKGRLKRIEFAQNQDGNPLEIGTLWDGDGWVNLYHDNGLLREKQLYRDGYLRRTKKAKE